MLLSTLLLAAPLVFATSVPILNDHYDYSHVDNTPLPDEWFQHESHPVHALFKRAPGDGVDYAPVGSPTWSAPYPRSSPDPNALPKPWVDALNAAVAAGKIPNTPQSSNTPQTNPVYPAGVNPSSPDVCSATYKCRIAGDIWDAPAGYFASSFDDGPYPYTPRLVEFLSSNNLKTTHFMIGINILNNPQQFLTAFNAGDDIGVHTWTHPYMTTLSNTDVLGQLGWTIQLIHNSTGGRVPRFWRPPYGDSDTRVRAIAKEVFGMNTVIWNQDTSDWSLMSGGTTPDKIQGNMQQWLTGSKTPGLIILEHEISDAAVSAFIAAFPLIAQNGWQFASLASLVDGAKAYQNAASSVSNDVVPAGVYVGWNVTSTSTTASSSTPASSTVTTSTGNLAASSVTPIATKKSSALPVRDCPQYLGVVSSLMIAFSAAYLL